ncbi:MAG: deaminase, partial [Anaerolineales bacterium]|nr:deaminase [Anaerolineales bacterium]
YCHRRFKMGKLIGPLVVPEPVVPNASQVRWDKYFLKMAELVASKSKDPSTQSGCVIVGPGHEIRSTGYNGLVRGARDDVPERNERPEKYLWYEHSERNAVFNAARSGIALAGCTAYINWHPCSDCTRALIQAGVVRIVAFETPDHLKDRWENHIEVSNQMMCEVGVVYIEYPRPEEKK